VECELPTVSFVGQIWALSTSHRLNVSCLTCRTPGTAEFVAGRSPPMHLTPMRKDKLLIRHGCPAAERRLLAGPAPQHPESGGLAELQVL